MTDFDKATIAGLVLAVTLAAIVLAITALSPSTCRESVTADWGRCDVGATVSLEMGDRVVCRCPVKP